MLKGNVLVAENQATPCTLNPMGLWFAIHAMTGEVERMDEKTFEDQVRCLIKKYRWKLRFYFALGVLGVLAIYVVMCEWIEYLYE
jgi:hypothetical protein